jgi:hypothetical protein
MMPLIKFFNYFLIKFRNLVSKNLLLIFAKILIFKSRNFYKVINLLEKAEVKIYSQNGEDGIIDYINNSLELVNFNFVEIGVGDYSEANTRYLYENYYSKGLIVDNIDNFHDKVKKNINLWKGDLRISNTSVTSKNINNILAANCNYEIDLFSLDIDGIDYWVLKELKPQISKVFIAEYNPIFGDKLQVTVPNLNNFNRKDYHYSCLCFGMSLKALINLMDEKGYYFLGTNRLKNNAFFISKFFDKIKYFPKIIINNLEYYTNNNFRESRDVNGNLNYLSKDKALTNIYDCEVVDLSNNSFLIKKIRDFF